MSDDIRYIPPETPHGAPDSPVPPQNSIPVIPAIPEYIPPENNPLPRPAQPFPQQQATSPAAPFGQTLKPPFGPPQNTVPLQKNAEPVPGIPAQQAIPPNIPQGLPPFARPQPVQYGGDIGRMLALPPISRAEAEQCRHGREKAWYRRLIELNILLVVSVVLMAVSSWSDYRKEVQKLENDFQAEFTEFLEELSAEDTGEEESQDGDEDEEDEEEEKKDYLTEFTDNIPDGIQYLAYGIMVLVVGYLALYYSLAQVRASALKITPRNFPEIYALAESYAARLGMQMPDIYVAQGNGILNAFSAFIPHRQYILLNTEIFETAYREFHDVNAVGFVLAHEMAHIYYGHATLHYNLPIWFSMNIPLFGQIASRTREYSCDRLAQMLTCTDGLDAMFLLMVDRHLYRYVDKIDYLDHAVQDRGFFTWVLNLFSTHPIMTKRIRALAMRQGDGELY